MTHKLLIVGGGLAGMEAAIKARKYGLEATLVSDRPYVFMYPVAIWIPIRKKKFDDVCLPVQPIAQKHGFQFVQARVEKLLPDQNEVKTDQGILHYEHLIVALGMSKVQMNGLDHTLSICGAPEQSVQIQEKLDQLIQNGKGSIAIGFGGNPKDEGGTAVRGGPAFELLFNLSTHLKRLKIRDQFRLHFFAPMAEPGKRMGKKPLQRLGQFYERYKISAHIGKKIKKFEETKVVFEDDSILESDLTIFIAGGKGHELIQDSGLPVDAAGFLKIDDHCQVLNFENIYAIGDSAAIIPLPWAAKQGHTAEVMADVAAFNIAQKLASNPKRKTYVEHLNIICMMDSGDGAALVFRNEKKEMMLPLPLIGHWLKKAWGFYYKNSKMKRMPRVPGM